ncbi:MAG: Crp/Fnr family transcriptional regulator [Chthoniobacteraceae bacterium]
MDCQFLRSVSFLKELADEELEAFSRLFTLAQIPPGEKIVEEGKAISSFYIVVKGTVHVRRTALKKELLLGRISGGGFFGEINLFDPGVATGSIYAIDKVALASTDYETLRTFMSENPATGYKIVSALMSEVSRRLRLTNQRFVNSVYWASETVK